MGQVIRPMLSADQVRALVSVAEDRVLEGALFSRELRDRKRELLSTAVHRLKDALERSNPKDFEN